MDKYRVIVMREGAAEDETLFEIAGSASLVQSIVPGVLDAVLATPHEAPEASTLADRVFDSAVTAGAVAEQQGSAAESAAIEAAKTKRKRRTKVEIAADEAAVALGFRDAAHRAEAEAAPAVPAGYAPPAGEQVVGSVPGPIVTEQPAPAPATAPPATPVPAPAGAGGAPWNPFVQPTH